MSTIAVVGGTGFTGANIATEAVKRGHSVVALSRSAPSEPIEGVQYEQGDAAEVAHSEGPITKAEVIVGALSPRAGSEGTLLATYQSYAYVAADHGVRLVIIGGFSSLRPADGAPRFVEGDEIPEAFAAEAREMNSVLEWLTSSAPEGLDWLFISPAADYGSYLPQGEPRSTYRTGGEIALFDDQGTSAISGADFAYAVLDAIEAGEPQRAHLHFAY